MNIRIPVNISATELDLVIAIAEKYAPNIAICFTWTSKYDAEPVYNEVKEHDVPFYFSYPIESLDSLIAYTKLGVSDVFISGQLAFDLDTVKYWTKDRPEKPIQIRCYPNICQNGIGFPIDGGIKDFFIRPEDIDLYDEYIDVIEFYDSVDTQNVLYDIYFHTKEWNGNLQEIIKGLQRNVNSYYILGNEFATRRMNCDKKCLKGKRCNLCNYMIDLAESLEKSESY